MFWLKVVKYSKLAAVWCRQHWRWLVLFISFLIVYLAGRKHSKSLLVQAQMAKEFYEEEKDAINKAYKIEIERREQAQKRYSEAVVKVEQEYEKQREDLTHAKKEEIKRLIKKASDNSDEIDSILENELGIKKS
jgi:hypothetical protein